MAHESSSLRPRAGIHPGGHGPATVPVAVAFVLQPVWFSAGCLLALKCSRGSGRQLWGSAGGVGEAEDCPWGCGSLGNIPGTTMSGHRATLSLRSVSTSDGWLDPMGTCATDMPCRCQPQKEMSPHSPMVQGVKDHRNLKDVQQEVRSRGATGHTSGLRRHRAGWPGGTGWHQEALRARGR